MVLAIFLCGLTFAKTLYKYRGPNGEWIFSDRPPKDGGEAEVRSVNQRDKRASLVVTHSQVGSDVVITTHNGFHAPMEVAISFEAITGIEHPGADNKLRWVVAPNADLTLLRLRILDGTTAPHIDYKYSYLPGDPNALHQPQRSYRAPFSVGANFPITQAYPDAITHQAPDSRHAIDIAMPIGTDIVAAREGIVFDVASKNYRAGADPHRDGQAANIVYIMHDDGTFALYAHLNWNSIRVNPGDHVEAGEYIADSGNTGFSTGPHLHFVVQKNTGFKIASLPVVFKGANLSNVKPATGASLTAYP